METMMSDERSAAEIFYGRAAREAPDLSFATSDDGQAEQGMSILLEGIRKAIDAGRSRGGGPIDDAVWRRQATEREASSPIWVKRMLRPSMLLRPRFLSP